MPDLAPGAGGGSLAGGAAVRGVHRHRLPLLQAAAAGAELCTIGMCPLVFMGQAGNGKCLMYLQSHCV